MSELTLADVLDVEFPGRPAWADDGNHVAVSIYEDDGKALLVGRLVAGERGALDVSKTRYRPGEGHVGDVAWRPDAPEIAVTTDDGGLHLVDVDARDTTRLARERDGISEPTWSPDGERLAYYRGGRPVVRSMASGSVTGFDVPAHDRFLPSARMLSWDRRGERLAFVFVDRETTQVGVVDVPSGSLAWRSTDLGASRSPDWLADGRLLVDRRRDEGTVREVIAVGLDGGAETVLFEEVDRDRGAVSRGPPEVSPDGTRVAATLPLSGWDHVYVHDVRGGETTQLTSGTFEDCGVADGTPRWVDDGMLVFASNRQDPGQRQLFAVDVGSGAVSPVVEDAGTNVHPAPSPDGERVAYVHADRERSPEVRVAPLGGENLGPLAGDDSGSPGSPSGSPESPSRPIRVSESVVDAWPVDPVEPEHVTFESHDGLEIHGYLIDPRDAGVEVAEAATGHEGIDADAEATGLEDAEAEGTGLEDCDGEATGLPALVWVHGGPMRQMRDGWHPSRAYGLAYTVHQYLARRGYVGLLVNYRGGIGYGREFRQALADGYGRDEMGDVAAAAGHLRDREFVDPDAIGIWGLSYGGYATLQILGTDPDAFDLGISLAGLVDLEAHHEWAAETKSPAVASTQSVVLGGSAWDRPEEWAAASPVTHMDSYDAPLYSFHGTDDGLVDVGQQDLAVDELLDLDAEFEAEYYPGEGHVFARRSVWRRTLRKIEDALDRHL